MGDLGLPSLAQPCVLACKYHKGCVIRFRHDGSRCEVGEGEDGGHWSLSNIYNVATSCLFVPP